MICPSKGSDITNPRYIEQAPTQHESHVARQSKFFVRQQLLTCLVFHLVALCHLNACNMLTPSATRCDLSDYDVKIMYSEEKLKLFNGKIDYFSFNREVRMCGRSQFDKIDGITRLAEFDFK